MTAKSFPAMPVKRLLSSSALCLTLFAACTTDTVPEHGDFATTSTHAATTSMPDGGGALATTTGMVGTTGMGVDTTGVEPTTTGLPGATTGEGTTTGGVDATTGLTAGTTGEQVGTTTGMTTGGELDAGASTGEGDSGPEPVEDLGKGDGEDVVTIGDSWMNYFVTSGGIEGALDRAGTSYRHHGVAGTKMLNGQIPSQFDDAVRNNPDIKTVIMTGGGNDVLLEASVNDCPDLGPTCQMQLERIQMSISDLLDTMAGAGVLDVVYVGYSEGAGDASDQATNVSKNGVGDMCAARTDLNCYAIDSTPIVMNGLSFDGIHPTAATSDKIAAAVLALMEEKGMRR